MKLLSKINRTYFRYGILVFLIADVVIILMSNFILKEEIDQQLLLEAELIAETVEQKGNFLSVYPTDIVEEISYSEISKEITKDTVIYDSRHDDLVPYRELRTFKSINGKHYQIITRQMLMEFDDIFSLYTALISTVLGLIFVLVLLFTQKMNTILWGTFNKNVDLLKEHSFSSNNQLELNNTGIDEFDALNQVLKKMSDRLEKDYLASKEFSANAAHELQTPLSIIKNKCEDLFSYQDLNEKAINSIHEIYVSADRLSGITKALLLLAKIDHGQFNENELINLNQFVDLKIESLKEILEDKNLKINFHPAGDCIINMDKRLANLWIQNILINAIKYSPDGEKIAIQLNNNSLFISNFGEKAITNPEQIFNRFYKESEQVGSSGIGLAIVKKITDHYKIEFEYHFKNSKHVFEYRFPK